MQGVYKLRKVWYKIEKSRFFNQQICAGAHIEKQSFSIMKSRVAAEWRLK
jgi:hypothetical protein